MRKIVDYLRKKVKKIWKNLEGINGIVLSLYVTFILSANIFLQKNASIPLFVRNTLITTCLSLIICPMIIRFAKKKCIRKSNYIENKADKKWKIIFFIIPMIVFLIYYIAYYPGGFSPDSIDQYSQAITNRYSDWHPVVHTLLAFKIPLTITDGWIGSIVLFQIIELSLIIGYSVYSIYIYTNKKVAIFTLCFLLLNPQISVLAMYPWKDIWFAMGAILLMTFVMHMYFTNGKWMNNYFNMAIFIIVIALTTLIRHNAILFTAPVLFIILFYVTRRKGFTIVLVFLILALGIKYPLNKILYIEKPGFRQTETLGMPMTIIGTMVVKNPKALDSDILDFAYKVAKKEVWQSNLGERLVYEGYNVIKFYGNTNNTVIEEYGAAKILNMMFRCIKTSPRTAFIGLIELTDPLYTINNDHNYYYTQAAIVQNNFNITSKGIKSFRKILNIYSNIFTIMFPHLFVYIGSMLLILLIAAMSKCNLKTFEGWKKLLFIIPVFSYNFGTMFLLTGAEDNTRFFFYTFLITPILLIVYFRDNNKYKKKRVDNI